MDKVASRIRLREKGFEVPLFSTVSGFSAMFCCRYGAIASPLQCNRVAVTVQSQRHYGVTAKNHGRKRAGKAFSSSFFALNGAVPKC